MAVDLKKMASAMDDGSLVVYHVAGSKWYVGAPLRCWADLEADGIVDESDWRWADAEVGYDGHLIALHTRLEDAVDHAREFGGTILAIDLGAMRDVGLCDSTSLTVNDEGYLAIMRSIPAEFLRVVG